MKKVLVLFLGMVMSASMMLGRQCSQESGKINRR